MDLRQNLGTTNMHIDSEGDESLKKKCYSVSTAMTTSENMNGCFDCNICLESSHDPVVTLCGHLYCWPCIYKWLQIQTPSLESDEQPKCPVCKAYISTSSLVPLYGRGMSSSASEVKKPELDLGIPQRPQATGMNALVSAEASTTLDSNQQYHPHPFYPQHQADHHPHYFSHPFGVHTSMTPTVGSSATTVFSSPTINMVGELVFARIFGSSDASMFAYPYPNSYSFLVNGSPRLRRQEMQLDKSLNRVTIFLFCCIALCLVLF